MVRGLQFLSAMMLLTLLACFEEPVMCTEIAVTSVNVSVSDEEGAPIAGAIVSYSVDGEPRGACHDWQEGSFACGTEEEGLFEVVASAEGFVAQTQEVLVEADECHVIPEELAFVLVEK